MNRKKIISTLLCLTLLFQWNGDCFKAAAEEAPTTEEAPTIEEAPATLHNQSKQFEESQILISYKEEGERIADLPKGTKEVGITESCSLITVGKESDLGKTLTAIGRNLWVEYVEPNYKVKLQMTQDKFSEIQWAYYNAESNINVEEAWALEAGVNEEVIVAVVDTGIDYQHVDLAENMWVNVDETEGSSKDEDGNGYRGDYYGWNFVNDTNDICSYEVSKKTGIYIDIHGTHVAGIVSAVADNDIGIAGVASYANVKIMSCKALGEGGEGNMLGIIKAIEYAEENGASICNLSLGTADYSNILYKKMKDSDMLFVCAAGNGTEKTNLQGYDITETPIYPAAFNLENIISVANTNATGEVDSSSCFSNRYVDIAAPGTAIVSTYVDEKHTSAGRYIRETGTSMAAPFVTGTAAMLCSYYGELPAAAIKKMILGGSKKLDDLSEKVAEGSFLDVYGAMTYQGMLPELKTEVMDISYSNYKKYIIALDNPLEEEVTVLYAKGNQEISYFQQGKKGEPFIWKGTEASITVKQTEEYTIYLQDSAGNERIYTDKIVVPKLTKIALSETKKTLHKGDSFRLKTIITQKDAYASILCESSNASVAKVSSAGKVVAIKKGTATITVTAIDGKTFKKAKCKITVR